MFEFKDQDKYHNKFGIYQIKNLETGCVYVGQTRQPFQRRFFYHRWQLRTNCHENPYLQSSYNKHGEDAFEFSVRVETENTDELDKLEISEIKKAREEGPCYNMLSGGGGHAGIPLTEAQKKMLGELNRKLNTGKKASEETKRKMSEKRKGKKRPEGVMEKTIAVRTENIKNGTKYKSQKITVDEARAIKIDLMNNVSYEDLASKYGVTYSNINAIRSNRSWKYVEVEGWDEYCESHRNNVRARQSRSAN